MAITLDTVEQQRIDALRILKREFRKGDQVRYIPSEAKNNPNHSSCQTGICVSGIEKGVIMVRYFRNTYLQATIEATAVSSFQFWGESFI